MFFSFFMFLKSVTDHDSVPPVWNISQGKALRSSDITAGYVGRPICCRLHHTDLLQRIKEVPVFFYSLLVNPDFIRTDYSNGSWTRITRLRVLYPKPLDDGAVTPTGLEPAISSLKGWCPIPIRRWCTNIAGTGFEPVSSGYEPDKASTPPTCNRNSGARTHDLMLPKHAFSHLNYIPIISGRLTYYWRSPFNLASSYLPTRTPLFIILIFYLL